MTREPFADGLAWLAALAFAVLSGSLPRWLESERWERRWRVGLEEWHTDL